MEHVEQRTDAARKELAVIRSQRAVATEVYHHNARQWKERQQELKERLNSRACGTLIYLPFFDKKSLPSSIVMRQAMLCSYLHNIEVNKFQMKLLTWQSMDITDHFHRQMSCMKEESAVSQIATLNGITEVQLSISKLEDAFKRLNDARRSKILEHELSQELCKVPSTTAVMRSPVDARSDIADSSGKKQLSHRSVISEFETDLQHSYPPSIYHDEPCTRIGILMKAKSRLWNVSQNDMLADFASVQLSRLDDPVLVNPAARVA